MAFFERHPSLAWLRLLGQILVIDVVALLVLLGPWFARERQARGAHEAVEATRDSQASGQAFGDGRWNSQPTGEELGRALGGIVFAVVQDGAGSLVPSLEVVGDDYVLSVSPDRSSGGSLAGYPAGTWCPSCDDQSCFFSPPARLAAFRTLTSAFQRLRDLPRAVQAGDGGARFVLEVIGTADNSPVIGARERRTCTGAGGRRVGSPTIYSPAVCGEAVCEVAGVAQQGLSVGTGLRIGDNGTLACLRALCLEHDMAITPDGDLDRRVVGRVADSEGDELRIPAVRLTLRGLARSESQSYRGDVARAFSRSAGRPWPEPSR